MKLLLWFGGESNQSALANKIHDRFGIAGYVKESRVYRRQYTFKQVMEKVYEKLMYPSVSASWRNMLQHYEQHYQKFPDTQYMGVEDINHQFAYDFTSYIEPDLVMVSGTGLVRKRLLELAPPKGILNLHTGLSPYIKGGPNCTNWCIATQQYHLIGNTVMWIDAGIDTGNILATEFTPFDGTENLSEIHIKVMEHAHDLYLRCIDYVIKGGTQSIPQAEIAEGKTYYTKDWTLKLKIDLVRNLKAFRSAVKNGSTTERQNDVRTVSLPE